MQKKLLKRIIGISLSLVICGGIFYWQTVKPLVTNDGFVRIVDCTKEEIINLYDYYESEGNDAYQFIRTTNIFQSDEDSDYCSVNIFINIDNNSVIDQNNLSSEFVCDDPDNSRVIMTGNEGIATQELEHFCTDTNTYLITLYMYRGDMTDEEVLQYVEELEFKLKYRNQVFKHCSKKIELDSMDIEIRN